MTLYFEEQFLKLKCTENTKKKKKKNQNALESDRMKKVSSLRKISPRTRKENTRN